MSSFPVRAALCCAALFPAAAALPFGGTTTSVAAAEAPSARQQVTGRVVTETGDPVAGAQVTVEALGGTGAGPRRAATSTDATGAFAVRAIADAPAYRVSVSAAGFAPAAIRSAAAAAGARAEPLRIVLRHAVLELAPLAVIGAAPAEVRAVPGATAILDAAALRRQRPDAAHHALRRTTGVQVMEEDPLGLNLNIGVRGLNPRRSARVLLLEDGAPIHLGPYGDPSAHYQPPAEVLERIEVLKGSGQILHGPQTVGGVVNFLRSPPPPETGGTVLLRAGDGGRFTGHAHAGTVFGMHAAAVSWNRRAADGARTGWHHAVDDVSAQLLLRAAAGTLLLKAGAYDESSRFGETGLRQHEFERDPFGNPSPNDRFDLRRYAASAIWQWQAAPALSFSALLYGQDVHRVSWRQASDARDRFGDARFAGRFGCAPDAASLADCGFQGRPRDYRFAGAEPRLRLLLGEQATRATLDVGARLHRETSVRRQYLSATAAVAGGTLTQDNALDSDADAAYVQLRVRRGAWAVTPGIRFEHVRSRNHNRLRDLTLEDRYTRWLPGVGLAVDASFGATLYAGTHRGFAPPRPADILDPAPGAGLVQVEPEVSWNHEVGFRALAFHAVALEATIFRIRFENQIVDGSLAGAGQRFVNAGETLHQGAEIFAELIATTGAVRPVLAAGYTFLPHAEFLSDELSSVDRATPLRGNRIPYAPRHMLHGTAGLATAAGLSLALRASHTGEQFSDDLNTRAPSDDGMQGVLPAWTLLGVAAEQRFERVGVSLFATVENLRDTVYITERQHGIMVGLPRRTTLGIEWRF